MDTEYLTIKKEPEASIYPSDKFYWRWRLHHCPVLHTVVTSKNANGPIRNRRIVSTKMQEANDPGFPVSPVVREESKDPEFGKFFKTARRSLDLLAAGGTAVKLEIKTECVDLETLTEENINNGGENTYRYADPWDSVVDPENNERTAIMESERHLPFKQKSTNTWRRTSDFFDETTSASENITVTRGSTKFEAVNWKRTHECHICKKAFKEKKTLTQHIMIHSGEKSHLCHICKTAFTQKATLDCHVLIHTGRRPHKCHTCEKSFTQKTTLNSHMLIHTGERPYVCQSCHKAFRNKTTLVRHMLIHTGEKPHQCNICKRAFTQKGNLNRHSATHCWKKVLQVP